MAGVGALPVSTMYLMSMRELRKGSSGAPARDARALAEELKRRSRLPVSLYDERLSSVEAERTLVGQGLRRAKRRLLVDQLAAVLVLQSFLERKRGG